MPGIFLSHASSDRHLALQMKELLKQSLQDTPSLTVFCSSDVGDIEGGKKWFDQIMQHLKKANACVSIMTPQSVYSSPWVAYESGGAYLRFEINPRRSRLFPVCAYGMTASILPSPFNELQVRHLADKAEIHSLCRELAGCLGNKKPRLPRKAIQEVMDEASKGSPHWAHVHQALVGQRQGSSPFSIDNMLKQASTDVFCAGFNLHHVATTPLLKNAFFEFLAKSPRESPPRFRGFVPFDRNTADLQWCIVGNDECLRFQVLQESLVPELFHTSNFISAVLHKARQSPEFLGMTFAVEQANFLCDVRGIFPFSADVGSEKQIFFLIARGSGAEYEHVLRLPSASLRPVLLLWSNRDRVCTKKEIESVGHAKAVLFSASQRRSPGLRRVFPQPLLWRVRSLRARGWPSRRI